MSDGGSGTKDVGIAPHVLFLLLCLAAVVWMEMATRLPWWAAVLVVSPQSALVMYALLTERAQKDEAPRKPRRFESASGIVLAFATLLAGIRAASYFFLIYLYGMERVTHEHLRFVAMPKGHPWIVSNGDRVSEGHFLHYLIGMGIWMALFPLAYWVVYRLLPECEEQERATHVAGAIR